ncbi:Superoxide dismutase [Psidium guajava]|nr:Superoxide dismutase [Psidium guajava]
MRRIQEMGGHHILLIKTLISLAEGVLLFAKFRPFSIDWRTGVLLPQATCCCNWKVQSRNNDALFPWRLSM